MSERKFKNEAAFQKWLVKQLREEFGESMLVVPTTMTGYGMSGVSDLLVCYFGMFWAIELKMDGKKPTPLQMQFTMKVDRAGGRTAIPVTPNPNKDGNGGVDQFFDYLRAIKQFREGQQIVQSLTPDEAAEVLEEAKAIIAAEEDES